MSLSFSVFKIRDIKIYLIRYNNLINVLLTILIEEKNKLQKILSKEKYRL